MGAQALLDKVMRVVLLQVVATEDLVVEAVPVVLV
tara:strand:- start:430 stop:534 length:105 start_codon:yes stop_codon:yes gene_type:complete